MGVFSAIYDASLTTGSITGVTPSLYSSLDGSFPIGASEVTQSITGDTANYTGVVDVGWTGVTDPYPYVQLYIDSVLQEQISWTGDGVYTFSSISVTTSNDVTVQSLTIPPASPTPTNTPTVTPTTTNPSGCFSITLTQTIFSAPSCGVVQDEQEEWSFQYLNGNVNQNVTLSYEISTYSECLNSTVISTGTTTILAGNSSVPFYLNALTHDDCGFGPPNCYYTTQTLTGNFAYSVSCSL
jgi:hypothetical protein